MAYSKEVYRIAKDRLDSIRDNNFYKKEMRKKEIYEKLPEISLLKTEETKLLNFLASNFSDYEKVQNVKNKIIEIEEKIEKTLVESGYEKTALLQSVDCKLCGDKGYILNERCQCFDKILKEVAREKSNFNHVLDKQTFENFDISYYKKEIDKEKGCSPQENMLKNLSKVNEFVENFDSSKSLVFMGKTGLGKTFMASCIANKVIERGYSVFYQTASKLIEILEDYKFNRRNSMNDLEFLLSDIHNCDLLIIDDFGTEYLTGYTITAIYELISKRIIENKKTIITTNLCLENIGKQYTERMLSRLVGDFQIMEFFGDDVRINKV